MAENLKCQIFLRNPLYVTFKGQQGNVKRFSNQNISKTVIMIYFVLKLKGESKEFYTFYAFWKLVSKILFILVIVDIFIELYKKKQII